MSTKSAPFYWLVCDAEGCTMREPNDFSDYIAWATSDQSVSSAEASEWAVNYAGRGKDYCPDCAPTCDCMETMVLATMDTCDEFRRGPNNPDFCDLCKHLEECH